MNRQMIHEHEPAVNSFMLRIKRAFAAREKDSLHWQTWEDSCDAWHTYTSPVNDLWNPETRAMIKRGEAPWLQYAITYLEEDPWYFRAGYLKERLIRALKSAPLTPDDSIRLRKMLLQTIDSRRRREFRDFCRLASKIADASFIDALQQRLTSEDKGIQLRSGWMLTYINNNVNQKDA